METFDNVLKSLEYLLKFRLKLISQGNKHVSTQCEDLVTILQRSFCRIGYKRDQSGKLLGRDFAILKDPFSKKSSSRSLLFFLGLFMQHEGSAENRSWITNESKRNFSSFFLKDVLLSPVQRIKKYVYTVVHYSCPQCIGSLCQSLNTVVQPHLLQPFEGTVAEVTKTARKGHKPIVRVEPARGQ